MSAPSLAAAKGAKGHAPDAMSASEGAEKNKPDASPVAAWATEGPAKGASEGASEVSLKPPLG